MSAITKVCAYTLLAKKIELIHFHDSEPKETFRVECKGTLKLVFRKVRPEDNVNNVEKSPSQGSTSDSSVCIKKILMKHNKNLSITRVMTLLPTKRTQARVKTNWDLKTILERT